VAASGAVEFKQKKIELNFRFNWSDCHTISGDPHPIEI
jgi:hypothetical protein